MRRGLARCELDMADVSAAANVGGAEFTTSTIAAQKCRCFRTLSGCLNPGLPVATTKQWMTQATGPDWVFEWSFGGGRDGP